MLKTYKVEVILRNNAQCKLLFSIFRLQVFTTMITTMKLNGSNNGFSGNSGAAETSLTFEVDVVNSLAAAAHLLVEFLATW